MLKELYERKYELNEEIENFWNDKEAVYGNYAEYLENEYKKLNDEYENVIEEIKYFEFYKRNEF
jgi:hypothetical protein